MSYWIVLGFAVIILLTRNWNLINGRNENRHLVRELGLFGYTIYDIGSIVASTVQRSRIKSLDVSPYARFLADRAAERGDVVGTSAIQKNVVFLQLESVDGFCVWGDFEGNPLMPRLREIASKGVAFSNTLDVTHSGRTVDAELLALTSLVPIRGSPAFVNYSLNRVPSLPRILNDEGYHTLSVHGYEGYFWNRAEAHRALGYQEGYFLPDIPHTETIGWGVSDEDALEFAYDKISEADGPVFAHLILLTHHHPYNHVGSSLGLESDSIERDFLISLRYVDEQIGRFYDQLQESGNLENTILAIYGDHDSGITDSLAAFFGISLEPVSDSVPLIILGLGSEPRLETVLTGLQDLPVIVLDALGLQKPSTFIGNSLSNLGQTISHDGRVWSLEGDALVAQPMPVDIKRLTKLSLVRPMDLQGGN